MKLLGNGIVAQSGGPTPVINNSVCGVIQEWLKAKCTGTLYGALYGIKGVLQEDFVDLSSQSSEIIEGLRYTPGAALGSCRYKLKEEDYYKLLRIFKQHNIKYFFYIGGNDSMDTANRVHQLALSDNYPLKVIGIPKTIDNDLPFTDHCPGFGSAAKYLATTVIETGIDLKGLVNNSRVVILEVMGRNAGWLAAATALARREEAGAPHLICLPEVPLNKGKFLSEVERLYREIGYVYIVASEGLVDEKGDYLFAASCKDSFGHVQLGGLAGSLKAFIENETGIKARCNVPGTTQRSAMHLASFTDAEEAYMVGAEAVKLASGGRSGLMVTLTRADEDDYRCLTGNVELGKVANVEKKIPAEWISGSGHDVTSEFINYVSPLIRGEITVPIKNGLPNYVNLMLNGFADPERQAVGP
ncbi:MAG: 6-phosphofructokinase [Bacillota bacterium]|nr:6-phosphofructokinase [Bacillota bacterium]